MAILNSRLIRQALVLILIGNSSGLSADDRVSFNFDVRPILSDRCFICHGPDAEKREAELRLDTAEGAFKALEQGTGTHVVKPGDSSQSEVYLRISATDKDLVMPPPDSNLSLTKTEIETIQKWIEQGAKYEGHWAFETVRTVQVPEKTGDWGNNEIDRFILQKMQEANLTPVKQASKEKLLRRVTFDITGLPPTLEELDAFLADNSPTAFEKVVDRLLATPTYGERMTTEWLDVARYSDTYGYQVDRDRFVWPWRDWVIKSFNKNMPYNQFITEQLAGDLLPDATDEQILATTFCRLHPQKVEGGSVPEEFRIEYIADRNQTFGTAFLGLTMECCRCHDHKYDPLSQKEYFQFSAFFDNIDEAGLYSFFTDSIPTPTLLLAEDALKAKLSVAKQDIAEQERKLAEVAHSQEAAFQKWFSYQQSPEIQLHGQVKLLDFEQKVGGNETVPGIVHSAIKLTGDDAVNTDVGNFKRSQPFSVSLWINTPDEKERAVIFHRSRAWTDAASRGYELLIEEGKLSAALIHYWPGNALRMVTKEKIPLSEWLHVTITYDGSSRAAGLKIFLNGQQAATDVVRDNLTKNITGGGGDTIAIGERFRDRGFANGLVDQFRVFGRELSIPEVQQLAFEKINGTVKLAIPVTPGRPPAVPVQSGLTESNGDVSPNTLPVDAEFLRHYYLSTVNQPYQQQLKVLEQTREAHNNMIDPIPEIMVMKEMEERKPSYVLVRGDYDKRGEPVSPAVAAMFSEISTDQPQNRLGLARWLTDPKHPLTARVAVNRYWQMIFGTALVRTPEDFGSQGQLPTHPDLLDWLAKDFVDNGWDVKRLIKQMVLSATYQQSSTASPELVKLDPTNKWLARSPSYRLTAEMLRDNALAASGLLVNKIGGAPAMPYEVEVSFKPTARAKGEGLYRRSLYTYWKRTGPALVMMTLDASKRDVCVVNRERTSSPLQAFVMLNGPQFVEASRMLAQKLLIQNKDLTGDAQANSVLNDLFRTLTSRTPTPAELQILSELYTQELATFTQHPEQASAYLKVGDTPKDESLNSNQLAAFAVVANTLFNFDECVIKR